MIWFTIALFFVSFLVTALLAPKPDIENARAGSLDDVQFPRATEDAPIPLVLGKVRLNSPNTLWYGDFEAVPIKEKIKTGLFSSTRVTVGHKYYLGLHLGLCLGEGVQMTEMFIDEESVWTGTTSATVPTTGSVDKPSLFGGYKAGGGWSGNFTFYPGSYTQPINTYVEGQVGSGNVPAYRGMSHIVLEKPFIGEQNSLKKMSFVLQKYTNSIGAPNSGKIGDDINPMEALYQILIDEWLGLGITTDLIDVPSLLAAGTTLYNEGNGISVLVTTAATGKTVIKEILRQADGIMYQDPETGKLKVTLIRQDYDVVDLDEYGEDDILQVRNFTKTAWEDVVAQVKVSYQQRAKESSAVAISQDMATANMIGRMKTVTMSFPFCYDKNLAADLASRERAQQSVPLFRMTLEMNRNAYQLRPGSVFKMSWPEYGLDQLVMRVQKHDLGELLNNKIVVDAIQDAFAVGTTIFAAPEDSGWVEPVTQPSDILSTLLVEMPYFYGSRLDAPVVDGMASVIPFAVKPSTSSSGFDSAFGIATGDVNLDVREPTDIEYPATGTLQAAYDLTAGISAGYDATGFVVENVLGTFPTGATLADIRTGELGFLYVNGEWMAYTTAVATSTTAISGIYRGLFGTQVKTHALGTRVYAFSIDQLASGVLGLDLAEASTVYYKLMDRVGALAQDITEVSEATFALNAGGYADRPLRPRNVKIDGNRTGITIADLVDKNATWAASNRAASQVAIENDAAETPDQTETYDLEVWVDGVKNNTLSSTGVSTPHAIPFSATNINSTDCQLRVYSRRTVGNLRSSVAYAVIPFTMAQTFLIGDTQYWDTYGGITASNLKGVYSLRRRISTYTGALVRVRDTVGGAEQDVGQDANGNLAAFSPAISGEARVVTWYDQSGNGLNLSQSTAANQPRLTLGTTAGRHARIEFGTVAGGGSHRLKSANFSDSAPNALRIQRPLWFGDASWVANSYFQYAFCVPQIDGSTPSPFYRFGILHEPDEGFEHRYNGNAYTEPSPYFSSQTGPIPWMLDAKSQSTINSYYRRMDAVVGTAGETGNITYPSSTNVTIGSNGATGEVWNGSTSDFVVADQATTAALRFAIAQQLRYWHNNVVFLSSFEGVDAATSATDDSITGHALTFNGNAQIDTAQYKWGSSSLLLDGTGDTVSAPDHAEFDLGSSNWTIDGWFRWNANPASYKALISKWNTGANQKSWGIFHSSANNLELLLSANGSTTIVKASAAFTPTLGTWYHIAATYDGTTYRLFVDGALVASATTSVALFNATSGVHIGGQEGATDYFNGWVDEVRVVNNYAVWVAGFSVPQGPYKR